MSSFFFIFQYNIMQIYLIENLNGITLNESKLSDIGQRNLSLYIMLCQTYKFNVSNRIKWLVDCQANLLSWIPMWKADHCRKSLMYNVANWYSFITVEILILLSYQIEYRPFHHPIRRTILVCVYVCRCADKK